MHQQNPPVLNWRCQLTQVDLYNGRKTGGCCCCYVIAVAVVDSNVLHSWFQVTFSYDAKRPSNVIDVSGYNQTYDPTRFFHIVHYHFSERLTDSNVGEMALIYFKIDRRSQVIMWKHYAGDNRIIQSSYLSIIQYVFWQLFHNKIDYNA